MASIKTTLCAQSNCGLLVDNVSGLKSELNPNGFLLPGIDTPIKGGDYLITDVYFFTFLIKNNSDGTFKNIIIPGNSAKQVNYFSGISFEDLVNTANIPQNISFTEDGYYSVYQLAIPKESVKDALQSASGDIFYVADNLEIWLRTDKIDLVSIILNLNTNWNNNNILMLRTDFVSKCFLENCFSSVLEVFAKYYTSPLCKNTDPTITALKEKRDLLFAITNTVQYYVELGQYYKAAKLLYDISYCGICSDSYTQSSTNCNCHG